MKRLIVMVFLCIFALVPVVYGANTVNVDGKVMQITIVDADELWSTTLPSEGISIHSIQYNPAAAGEICVIKEGSASGPIIFKCKSEGDTDDRIKYFGKQLYKPVFDFSDSTNSADGIIIILLR